MENIQLKGLILFILESIILQNGRYINEEFVEEFNDFVYKYYEDNKELFSYIFNTTILEQFIKNNYDILTLDQMFQLVVKYHGIEGYAKLVEDVGFKRDQKIQQLSSLFTEYYNQIIELYYADSSIYFPKGCKKIPQ